MRFLVFGILFWSIPMTVLAGSVFYQCEITRSHMLNDAGQVSEVSNSIYKDKKFVIERSTGKTDGVITSVMNNRDVLVHHHGDKDNSFKATITISGPHPTAMFIAIEEPREGNQKPFWLMDGGMALRTGICE